MRLLSAPPLGRSGRPPFILLVAMTACGTLGMHVIIPALPDTARALGMSVGAAQLTITLYLVGLALGQLLYGPISDRFGRRPVLLGGLTLFTLASIATAAASSAPVLITARVAQSLGGCSGLVLGRAAVRDGAAADKAAGQLALLTLVMAMVPAIAPAIGGYVTAWFGWRASFVLLAGFGALVLLACLLLMPETMHRFGDRPAGARRGSVSAYLLLLRSARFRGYAVGGACSTTAFYAFMSASPFIFERLLHQPPQRIGVYYLFLMLGVALGSLGANRVASRLAVSEALRIANGLSLAGASLFALVDAMDVLSVPSVIGPISLFMVGAGMASPFALAGSVSVNPRAIGAASGLYGFIQMSYGMICTIIVESWRPGSVYPVATVLLGSAVVGQVALSRAIKAERREVKG